jgi:Na+-transporting NADH:ubiquinone oxidoreductase subunit NqrC
MYYLQNQITGEILTPKQVENLFKEWIGYEKFIIKFTQLLKNELTDLKIIENTNQI